MEGWKGFFWNAKQLNEKNLRSHWWNLLQFPFVGQRTFLTFVFSKFHVNVWHSQKRLTSLSSIFVLWHKSDWLSAHGTALNTYHALSIIFRAHDQSNHGPHTDRKQTQTYFNQWRLYMSTVSLENHFSALALLPFMLISQLNAGCSSVVWKEAKISKCWRETFLYNGSGLWITTLTGTCETSY